MSSPQPHKLQICVGGQLVRDAEVMRTPDGGVEFVVELQHTPPVIGIEHYPPGCSEASYIAAKDRARLFKAGQWAMVRGQNVVPAKWHGHPVWRIESVTLIALVDGDMRPAASPSPRTETETAHVD